MQKTVFIYKEKITRRKEMEKGSFHKDENEENKKEEKTLSVCLSVRMCVEVQVSEPSVCLVITVQTYCSVCSDKENS